MRVDDQQCVSEESFSIFFFFIDDEIYVEFRAHVDARAVAVSHEIKSYMTPVCHRCI